MAATSLVDKTVARLRVIIKQRAKSGEQRLPPETQLSQELAVGRSTVREALALLEAEGIIDRRRRTGTTIRHGGVSPSWGPDAPAYPVHLILALSDFLTETDMQYEIRELRVRRVPATADISAALDLDGTAEVFDVDRLYAIEGVPGAYVQHFLPVTIRGTAVQISSLRDGATTFLQEIEHVDLANVESRITAEAADSAMATMFEVPEGTPLLAMHTRIFGRDVGVVALGRLVFRPDVVSMSVRAVENVRPVRSETSGR